MKKALFGVIFLCFFSGCSEQVAPGQETSPPYEKEAVIRLSDEGILQDPADNKTCAQDDPNCKTVVRKGDYCKDGTGPADVVEGKDKNSSIVVCYPSAKEKKDRQHIETAGPITIDKNHNVITFSPETNGKTFEGGVTLKGNGHTLYGNGPDKTTIKGDSSAEGNNHKIRGVTFQGNVTIKGNNPSMLYSVIEGDLTYEGNNGLFSDLIVYGNINITGNNHKLFRVYVKGKVSITGKNNECHSNFHFEDKNNNQKMDDGEKQDSWTCDKNVKSDPGGGKGKKNKP